MSISDTGLPFCSMKEYCAEPVVFERRARVAFRIVNDAFVA